MHETCGNSLYPPAPEKPHIKLTTYSCLVTGKKRGEYWIGYGRTLAEAWENFDRGPSSEFREHLKTLLDEIGRQKATPTECGFGKRRYVLRSDSTRQ